MKLRKLYEGVLKEGNAQACIAEFGKVLFGDQLGDQLGREEANTDSEDDHVTALNTFTDYGFGKNIKPEVMDAIYGLQSCMSTYPEILKPKTEMVYRGTSAPIISFIKNGQIPTLNTTQPYLYKANTPIQSWSEYESVAESFGDAENFNKFTNTYLSSPVVQGLIDAGEINLTELVEELGDIRIPIILIYKATSEDFLFKGKYINKLSEHGSEHEVIRVDDKPVMTKAYLNDKWVSHNSRTLIDKLNELL